MKYWNSTILTVTLAFLPFCLISCQEEKEAHPSVPTIVVTTVAGSEAGLQDGIGSEAKFNEPKSLTIGPDGNLYVADSKNGKIRKINKDGRVSTLEGSFEDLNCLVIAPDGTIYVADDYKIQKISLANQVSLVAAGYANIDYPFHAITGMAIHADGDLLAIDESNNRIFKISPQGKLSTYAGGGVSGSFNDNGGYRDGPALNAQFQDPSDMCLASDGAIYVADRFNYKIRKISALGNVSTVVGSSYGFLDGRGREAKFFEPAGITLATDGTLYVADQNNGAIRKISSLGEVTTIAGGVLDPNGLIMHGYRDGEGRSALFYVPSDVVVAPDGSLFVADLGNHRIRRITFK